MDNKTKLDELQKQHGEVVSFTTKAGQLFAFRRPTLEEFEQYQQGMRKGQVGVTHREICQATLVFPSAANGQPDTQALHAFFERAPLVSVRVSDELIVLSGDDIEVTVKKG